MMAKSGWAPIRVSSNRSKPPGPGLRAGRPWPRPAATSRKESGCDGGSGAAKHLLGRRWRRQLGRGPDRSGDQGPKPATAPTVRLDVPGEPDYSGDLFLPSLGQSVCQEDGVHDRLLKWANLFDVCNINTYLTNVKKVRNTVLMPKPLPLIQDSSPICCAPLGSPVGRLSLDDAIGLAVRLRALAEPARLQLVDYLFAQPNQEACTCDMAPVVGLSESTTSHHLKRLFTAGLVTKRRNGMNVHYQIAPEAMSAIARVLDTGRVDAPGSCALPEGERVETVVGPQAHPQPLGSS